MKVGMIGGRGEGNAVVDNSLDPRCVGPGPASLPALPTPGDGVVLREHGGRVRRARVVEVDGPLLQVTYVLKSGQWRGGWFDLLALQPPPAA